MAEKGFGVKEIKFFGSSPKIESPDNLNLNANNVAISTNATVGGALTVTGNVNVGGVLTYEDVTNVDAIGIITARTGVKVTGGEIAVGNNIKIGNAGVITATTFSGAHTGDGAALTGISGSGGVTVQDEGSTLSTQATTINFVGAGVVASGTGATKTITISGGGGSSTPADDDIQVVYTVSGSGVYNFTGNGVDSSVNYPELYMYRDTKYRFIHNAGGSHPIRIVTAQSGGSTYEDGVTYSDTTNKYTTQGNNLDFTPQHDAPNTLWYRCAVHSYVVGKINIVPFSGGSSRGNVTGTTGSLAQNAIGNITITGHKSYLLMNVALSAAGWIRLYTDSASRTNDASRSVGEDPAPGSGVIAEVVTTASSLTQKISPFVPGGNMDSTPSTNMYVAIKNLSSTSQAITANLTILKLED